MNIYLLRILLVIIGIQGVGRYQTLDLNSLRIAQKQAAKLKNTSREVARTNKSNDPFIIDSPVNSDEYLVGPGDHFHLNIISSNETFDYSLTISPTGTLLIPSVGIIDCKDLTLTNLIKEIKKTVRNWNRNIKINVELEKIRQFRVLVTGQFENAGYFTVTPMMRVSDLYDLIISDFNEKKKSTFKEKVDRTYSESLGMQSILAVDDFYSRKLGIENEFENEINKLSRRNISIFRRNDTLNVDLEKFKVEGLIESNPYINQNDVIKIPFETQYFHVSGGVQRPGKYEYKVDDSILDVIQIAGGFQPGVDLNKIKITRSFFDKPSISFYVDIRNIERTPLFANDHIMVPQFSIEEPHEMVTIDGQIKHPGRYPIDPGITTVNDIVNEAGGFLSDSDSTKFYINNRTISSTPDRELERILLKEEINRSVEEKAYVKARIRTQKGSLEINTHSALKSPHILTNNDEILIPKSFPYVEVIGAISYPGRYTFKEDITADQYIEMAGGLSKNSSGKKFLVKSMTGQRLKLKNNYVLQSGDIIFVAEKIEYNDEWFLFKEYLTSISQIAVLFYYIQFIYIRLP